MPCLVWLNLFISDVVASPSSPAAPRSSRPAKASKTSAPTEGRGFARVNRFSLPFGSLAGPDTLNDLFQVCLDHNAANDHLTEHGVQGFEAEDQVQLTDILE